MITPRLLPRTASGPRPGSVLSELGPTPSIVIVRRGRLGDMVVFSPALRTLRRALPGAHITLIVDPAGEAMARRYSWVDEVHVAPFPGNGRDESLDDFVLRLRRRRFDLALQCTGGGDTMNEFVLRMGARFSAGQRAPGAPDLDLSMPFQQPLQPEPLRLLDIMALIGAPAGEPWTEVPLFARDREELARAGVVDMGALESGRVIGLHPGSGSGSRRWAPDRYACLLDSVIRETGRQVVIVGGADERAVAQRVLSGVRYPERVADATGCLSLGALIALLADLYLYIGNDSGPAHIVTALDTPAVLIYGSGHPATWAPMRRVRQRPVYDRAAPCRAIGQKCGCKDDSSARCIDGVTVGVVLDNVRSLTRFLDMSPKRCMVSA